MDDPRISVVIPTRNRPDFLSACLDGFARQSVANESSEILVVDEGSQTPLDEVVAPFRENLDIQLLRRGHEGAAAARNVGAALARSDLLLLFDDDQRPQSDLVARCLAFHDEAQFLLLRLGPDLSGPRRPESFAMFGGALACELSRSGRKLGVGAFWGGAISCKRSVFRYGLYDPAYGMAEDVELGLRTNQALPLRAPAAGLLMRCSCAP